MRTRYLLRRASLIVATGGMFPIKIIYLAMLFAVMIAWLPFGASVLGDRLEWISGVLIAILAVTLGLIMSLANDWSHANRILRKWLEPGTDSRRAWLVSDADGDLAARRAALRELRIRGEDAEKWAVKLGLPSRYDPAVPPKPLQAESPQGPVEDALRHWRRTRHTLLRRG
jgi:hypothetical protein